MSVEEHVIARAMQPDPLPDELSLRFERRDVPGRHDRFCVVSVGYATQLRFDGKNFVVTIVRGRIADPLADVEGTARTREEHFASFVDAVERWGARCARLRYRGYAKV